MRPSNLLHQEKESYLSKEKLFPHKYKHKKRILTYQSKSAQLISSDHSKRYPSESHFTSQQSPFKETREKSQSKRNYSVTERSKQKRKNLKESHVRVRYYRSQGKEEDKQGSNSNPWGGPPISKGISPRKSSKEKLQEQRKSLQKMAELRESQQRAFMPSTIIKYKSNKFSQFQKLAKKQIPDYLAFIHGEGNYTLGFDFSYLRGLNKSEALKCVDLGVFRVLESIWLCVLDILGDTTDLPGKGIFKLLREYSLLYFRLFEKVLVEFVLYYHVFKLCQQSFIQFIINSRICMLILHETAFEEVANSSQYKPLLFNAITQMVGISKIFLEGQTENSQNYVTDTLKNLKLVSAAEKKIEEMGKIMPKLTQLMSQNVRIKQLLKALSPLIKQINMGGQQLQYLAQVECHYAWQFFTIPPIPYLSPKSLYKPYTLILTLDPTLLRLDPQTRMVNYRPHLDHFLQKASELFELVVWADQQQVLADLIIDSIERGTKIFSSRLYSEHFSLVEGMLGRDLTRLGRPTEKTLILESKQGEERRREKGLLLVKAFDGDRTDNQLLRILSRLEWMATGLPDNIIDREPLHLSTLEHIEEEIQENNTLSSR